MWARHLSEAELTEQAEGGFVGARGRWAVEHLRGCRTCAEAVERARATLRVCLAVGPVQPPRGLRTRIIAGIAARPLPKIECREALALIHESLDTRLPPLAAGFLRLHLDACPDCAVELATISEATRTARSLRPVRAPAGLREAARLRRAPLPVPWGVRLRPAFAAATVAVAALFLAFHSTLERTPAPRPVATRPSLATTAPAQPAEPPTVVVALPEAVEASPAATGTRTAAPSRRVVRGTGRRAPIVVAFVSDLPTEPIVMRPARGETGPSALRALRAVASAAAYDLEPHVSMAVLGERLATLDSEDMAASFPGVSGGLSAGETTSPTSSPDYEPAATESANPSNLAGLAGLMEGITWAA